MGSASEPPSERLRFALQECQARVNRTECALALAAGRLPVQRYACWLRALYILHDGLEQLVERSSSPALRAAFAAGPARRERLERDLAYLNTDKYGVDAAALHALVLMQGTRLRASEPRGAACLLGSILALASSRRVAVAQARALARSSELQRAGLSYLRGAPDNLPDLYLLLDASLADEAELAAAIDGAQHVMSGLEAVHHAVMSEGARPMDALNLAAGAHPLPRDLREVQAALAAGEQSRADFAYYEARYGERGRRFTRSDSAWLVTLAYLTQVEVRRQVAWLGRVLAARGMPRLLLERHLELLHARLVAELPAQRERYAVLADAAEMLGEERRARLSDARFAKLARQLSDLHAEATPTPPIPLQEAGLLLVAAVVDEACGVPLAVESLCRWLTDATHACEPFRAAVDQALRSARDAM